MKKFLLTASVLACMTALTKAQQGRVGINTTTPAATLDVVATTTDNTRPDALLVPRMTAAQLTSKDDNAPTAYAAAQNGAMVYITSGIGTGPRKAKITGPGFYYFDNTVPEWKPFGGGAVAGMTVRAQTTNVISDADLGNAIIVNTGGTVFNLDALTKSNGKLITFIDNTPAAAGFSVTGTSGTISSTATVSPTGPGGSLSYICDGTVWYSYSSY